MIKFGMWNICKICAKGGGKPFETSSKSLAVLVNLAKLV